VTTMDTILAPPSDEFAKHDAIITSVRKNNFQRLAGELHVCVATAVAVILPTGTRRARLLCNYKSLK